MCNVQEVNNTTKLMIICVKEEKEKSVQKNFVKIFCLVGLIHIKILPNLPTTTNHQIQCFLTSAI